MAYLDGDNGSLQKQTGNTFSDFADFRSASLNTDADRYDATTWTDTTFKVQIVGKRNFELSGEFVAQDTTLTTILQTLANSASNVYRFTPHATLVANTSYEGPMHIAGSLNVSQGSPMTGQVTLTAAGTITLNS